MRKCRITRQKVKLLGAGAADGDELEETTQNYSAGGSDPPPVELVH